MDFLNMGENTTLKYTLVFLPYGKETICGQLELAENS